MLGFRVIVTAVDQYLSEKEYKRKSPTIPATKQKQAAELVSRDTK